MLVAFSILPFRLFAPFGQYRHGCDPPARVTPLFYLPSALDGNESFFVRLSEFFIFPLNSPPPSDIEPFFQYFRHTIRQSGSPHSASLRFG